MDSIRVNIQNQEFIEKLIESNPELGVKINNAIIDSISKRLLKKVLENIDGATKNAMDIADEEISKKYLQCTYRGLTLKYELRPEHKAVIENEVNEVWAEEFDKAIQDTKVELLAMYERRLKWAIESYTKKFEEQLPNLNDMVKKEVENYFKTRLK